MPDRVPAIAIKIIKNIQAPAHHFLKLILKHLRNGFTVNLKSQPTVKVFAPALRSEGPAVSSHVRKGVVEVPLVDEHRRRATCAGPSGPRLSKLDTCPRPYGTGLLTNGPSDLNPSDIV